MKLFKLTLGALATVFLFFSQSALAAYGTEDVASDTGDKSTSYGTEVEVNEFVLLDAMPDIELYYYPYSADDADGAAVEDVPGGAGSVYVGGGVIKWHANVDTTISIDDFTLTNIDTAVTERNSIATSSGVGIAITDILASDAAAVAALTFDSTTGPSSTEMSTDMTTAYSHRANDYSSVQMNTDTGSTDFAAKFYLAVTLESAGSVQGAGTYRASATVRAVPTVSN